MIHQGNLVIRTAEDVKAFSGVEKVTGDLYIHSTAKLDAPLLYAGGFSNFKVHDGIPCVLLSSKKLGKTTLLSCRKSKIKNGKIVGDKFFVAQQGRVNAHGNTAREAVAELHFKTSKRDISQYKAMPLSTSNTPFEWGLIYRAITGACQFGVKDFMQRHGKLKKRYTLKEILEITKGAYRSEAFASVVKEPD